MKLSSDPIIRLAEVAAGLEGDDGWSTWEGTAWCGALGSLKKTSLYVSHEVQTGSEDRLSAKNISLLPAHHSYLNWMPP